MMNENRKLWKLILLTIPTLGIYNIYFWFRFTQDLNEMNREEKKIKNYILVWFLSIITLGIYRWVWLFYLEDRLQITGETMGLKVKPGPGTVLFLWTFGKFILVGPLLADFYIIRNMNQLAKEYNASFSKKTKVLNQKDNLKDSSKKTGTEDKSGTTKSIPPVKAPAGATAKSAGTLAGATAATTGAAGTAASTTTISAGTGMTKPTTGTANPAGRTPVVPPKSSSMNRSIKKTEEKPKVVNKQVFTPEKKTADTTPAKSETKPADNTTRKPNSPTAVVTPTKANTNTINNPSTTKNNSQSIAADKNTPAKNEAAATRETDKKASVPPSTVTLDVEKNRPRADDATLTVNPGMINMPMGKNNK